MKTPDKKAKDKLKAEKLKIRVIGRTPEKVKKWPTGDLELFKKIALERSEWKPYIWVTHIFPDGNFWDKAIFLEDLTVTNFSHIIGKGRDKTFRRRLPDWTVRKNRTVEKVSRAYHEWQHTKQIPKSNYIN